MRGHSYEVELPSWMRMDNVFHDDQYYAAHSFKHAPHKLNQYHDRNPDAPGPPRRLGAWLSAYLEDEDLPEHAEDDMPVKTGDKRKLRRNG